jgi:hypothetical protein
MLRNAGNAGQDWLNGVQNPRRSPTAAAKAAVGKWKNNMQKAIADGRYEKGLAKSSDAQIIATATKVGPAGYTSGIQARQDKIQAAIQILQPKLTAHLAKIDAMPQDTDQQREAKMIANLQGMRALKG